MSITASASSPAVSATVSGGGISASAQAGGVAVSVSAPSPVAASAAGGSVSAAVSGSSSVSADVVGGIGPSGLPNLSQALDVQLSSLTDGDVLRYSSAKWRNYAETGLVDGGNW